ncbi:putative nitrite reductase [Klebsiella pneumoniae subsp. ozaenae]|uniref:Putative nitrite reductase n=1 Tax=Klebsiella pneumoniae subsp. ozaenae TaxID=574 RepID=A0A378BC41_KLEPO|nr:putative nitrite reductase [Klebsiella pneumoniae subsp. ozaenae]
MFRQSPVTISRGCFVYRTLDDLDRIAAHAAAAKSGVVIGGGLLGLEAANALKQLGLETQVVEFAPNLMAVQLDNGGAAMLREKIVALGVGVHTSKATTAIVREADGLRLNFADGGALRTDMVVFSAGIRPQDALARGCALQVGERGGIHIDGQCRTSDPDVLAIGECALWDNKIYGLVAPGYQMARIAAATLAGEDACFSGADMSTKLKLLGGRRGLVWRCAGAHAGLSELSMDRRSAADLQKNRRQSGRQSPAWRRAGGGCQRLCHAAADDAERHGAAAASGESDPARAGGSRAEGARRRGAAGQRADLLLP